MIRHSRARASRPPRFPRSRRRCVRIGCCAACMFAACSLCNRKALMGNRRRRRRSARPPPPTGPAVSLALFLFLRRHNFLPSRIVLSSISRTLLSNRPGALDMPQHFATAPPSRTISSSSSPTPTRSASRQPASGAIGTGWLGWRAMGEALLQLSMLALRLWIIVQPLRMPFSLAHPQSICFRWTASRPLPPRAPWPPPPRRLHRRRACLPRMTSSLSSSLPSLSPPPPPPPPPLRPPRLPSPRTTS
jgi:hypothetical protein